MEKSVDVAVVGHWHLAFCTAACLASVGRRVVLVNAGTERWNGTPKSPVAEPGLDDMIQAAVAAGTLSFANGVGAEWNADVVWCAIDTPVDEEDRPDLAPLLECAKALKIAGKGRRLLAFSSQVPLGFCRQVSREFAVPTAYIPENLRLGQGIRTFRDADRTVIGADSEADAAIVKNLMREFPTEFLLCDLPTAEMIKHATNAFLATSISFANEMARVGERLGADMPVVAKALKMDQRIGSKAYVAPGLGFAGGTLPRDLRVLQSLGKGEGVPTPLVDAVLNVNAATAEAMLGSLSHALGGLTGKRILLAGYTYKADTDTLRRSPTLELAKALRAQGAQLAGFDPFLNGKNLEELGTHLQHHAKLEDVGAVDAVVLMTARPHFRETKWESLAKKSAPLFFDAQNFLDADALRRAGFAYKALWAPLKKALSASL